MGVKIHSIEYYLPEKVITNDELELKNIKWKAEKVYNKTGIRQRHIVKNNETALNLAVKAGEKALNNYNKDNIDYLIYCTQSPDYYLPSGSCIIQDRLGLNTNIGALDINLGCSGYIYGLSLCKGLINSKIAKTILFITAETYSKYINEKDIANQTIFGDGATATILEFTDNEQIMDFSLGTDGSGKNNLIVRNGGLKHRYDNSAEDVGDGKGNVFNDNNIYMNGPEIFNFTISHVPVTFNNTLTKNSSTLMDIDYVIFHQANKFILDYLREICQIPEEKFYVDLETTGNTVSNTIPIAIKRSLVNQKIKKGDKILLLGFGVGYSWGGVIIKV